jgi:hypothetical protein
MRKDVNAYNYERLLVRLHSEAEYEVRWRERG